MECMNLTLKNGMGFGVEVLGELLTKNDVRMFAVYLDGRVLMGRKMFSGR